jgi:epoxide hydrolase-like predicted phosphatase
MITSEQEQWLSHLSDTGTVKVVPYDPSAQVKFEAMKLRIQSAIGSGYQVFHRGASGLGISGQPEIDIYIPVSASAFDAVVSDMQKALGKPYSAYPLERTKFILTEEGMKFEIMAVNSSHKSWIENDTFFTYLKNHPADLDRYRKLKEDAAGLSNRAYYRKKIEFINDILSKSSPMTPITTFIFDCFGVVSDSVIGGWYKKNRLDKGFKDPELREILRQMDLGNLSEEHIVDHFLKYKDMTLSKEELRRDIDGYLKLNEPLAEMIRKLRQKGFKIALLTNANKTFFERKVYPMYPEFKGLFDEIIISSLINMVKPDKDIYFYALEKLKAKPEECAFIDDSAENVKTAVGLGMQGLVFTDNASFTDFVKRIAGDIL